jgi:orotidine-5'-phosphate decarboxylase
MNSKEKFFKAIKNGKHICVGLDTDIKKIPSFLLNNEDPVFEFNRRIIDSTIEHAAAYKLNFAFYEKEGIKGLTSLLRSIEYIGENAFVIGDAKRGDIGNTSAMYASALFDYFKVDASTLHPYMGYDSISPFLKHEDKINFILALTSNPGADDFEKLKTENGEFLYRNVIKKVAGWNKTGNCGIVFGATQLQELIDSIDIIRDIPMLLPGVGAQGGDLVEVLTVFKKFNVYNFLINSSRGIIYKDNTDRFDVSAKEELINLNSIVELNFYT